ncbi:MULTISPECIES: hypothetical protein [unclassified Caballeronia]|uniref:hypothetical protein n=1 Tax=unclassified Caballeronia TaxID=2646786 RepID=UPI003ECEEEB0
MNLPITHAFLLGILEAFTAATFSRFLIEAPFLRLKDRLATSLSAQSGEQAGSNERAI